VIKFFKENEQRYESFKTFRQYFMDIFTLQLNDIVISNSPDNAAEYVDDPIDAFEHDVVFAMLYTSLIIFIQKFFNIENISNMTFEQMEQSLMKFENKKHSEIARKVIYLLKYIDQSSNI